MSWTKRCWFSGVTWVFPLTLVLAVWYINTTPPRPFQQPVSSLVSASEASALTFPFLSVAATWTAVRLRAAGWYTRPHARARARLGVEVVAPLVAIGAIAYVVVGMYAMWRDETLGWPGAGVPTVYVSILVATCTWGYALGRWLRSWIATSLALLSTFAVLGFPPALEPVWLRHLYGISSLCCSIEKSVNTKVVIAATVVAVGSGVMGALVASVAPGTTDYKTARRRAQRLALALCAYLGAVAVGVNLVHTLPAEPVQPRHGNPSCEPVGAVVACAWPEHVIGIRQYEHEISAVLRVQHLIGSSTSETFSEVTGLSESTVTPFSFEPDLDRETRAALVADSLASQPETCVGRADRDTGTDEPGGGRGNDSFTVSLVLRQWWREQLSRELEIDIPPPPGLDIDGEARAALTKLRSRTMPVQGDWVRSVTSSRQQCGPNFMPR